MKILPLKNDDLGRPEFGQKGMEELSEPERIMLVEEAASNAQLLATVQAMPNGINTKIGDRSEENLSDGQTQRLSLARGFLKDAELMLMDEPTSALDPVVEQRVVTAIGARLHRDGRRRTGVIVAHRITTIASCDTILYLEKADGAEGSHLAEMGSHASLMTRGGKYSDFVKQLNKEAASQALPVQALAMTPAALIVIPEQAAVPPADRALLEPKRPPQVEIKQIRCTVAGVHEQIKQGLFGESGAGGGTGGLEVELVMPADLEGELHDRLL